MNIEPLDDEDDGDPSGPDKGDPSPRLSWESARVLRLIVFGGTIGDEPAAEVVDRQVVATLLGESATILVRRPVAAKGRPRPRICDPRLLKVAGEFIA